MKLYRSGNWDSLGPKQRAQLLRYEALLLRHAEPLGLLGPAEKDRIHDRHVLDSLRALPCIDASARLVMDMGSGAGLPGIPVAVGLPDLGVTLVERKRRRAAFLEMVVQELELGNVEVVHGSVSDLRSRDDRPDVCLARAFRSPIGAWETASEVMRRGGVVLYYAGRSWDGAGSDLPLGVRARVCVPATAPDQGPIVVLSNGSDPSEEPQDGIDSPT